MTSIINQNPYLRTTRHFPEEIPQLVREIDKSYLDIANAVNDRIIGFFPTNRPAITGEAWFITSQKQQSLRQVYTFTTTTSITHGVQVTDPNQFTHPFGTYTDGTNSYGLIHATTVAIAGQITFYITSTQIVFVLGAGHPALTSGRITLEWLSSV